VAELLCWGKLMVAGTGKFFCEKAILLLTRGKVRFITKIGVNSLQ